MSENIFLNVFNVAILRHTHTHMYERCHTAVSRELSVLVCSVVCVSRFVASLKNFNNSRKSVLASTC